MSDRAVEPTGWVKVPRTDLSAYQPWYKTIAGSTDSGEEVQGALYVVLIGSSERIVIEIKGTIEYKQSVVSTLTPAERRAAQDARDKQRLLRLLATPDVPATAMQASALGALKGVALGNSPAVPGGSRP